MVLGDGDEPLAQVRVDELDGKVYVHDLVSHDPGAMRTLMRCLANSAKVEQLWFPMGFGPQYDKLRRLATRLGGERYCELWRSSSKETNHARD